jgi:threonine dehydrogenase-like Zn-dependent dehydrogenase
MPAAVVAGPGDLRITKVPAPVLDGPEDVIVEVRAAGLCGTDLHVIRDPAAMGIETGTILGHELAGVVAEVGRKVSSVAPGDRVVVAAGACHACANCRRGHPHRCLDPEAPGYGFNRPGGFAPRVRVRAADAHRLPDAVPDWVGALVEPLSTVVHGVRLARPFPGERAVVLGAGPIGLLFTGLLTLAGADVVVVEPAPARRHAAAAMGATVVLALGTDTPHAVREATAGGPEIVVDAVGTQISFAVEVVRDLGRVVLFGLAPGAHAALRPWDLQSREIQLLGANVGSHTFAPAIRIAEQGRIDFTPVVSDRVALADLPLAVGRQARGEATKTVIELAR